MTIIIGYYYYYRFECKEEGGIKVKGYTWHMVKLLTNTLIDAHPVHKQLTKMCNVFPQTQENYVIRLGYISSLPI